MTPGKGIIGIDLGTTASVIAAYSDGKPGVINTGDGKRLPSVVAYSHHGEATVGDAARRLALSDPAGVVPSVKRLLGRQFDDPVVQSVCEQQPFSLREADDGSVEIVRPGSGRAYTPSEVVSTILRKLKQEAEAHLGTTVRSAVLTVPTHFDERQRQALRRAAQLTDLDVLSVIGETTAAALAYSTRRPEHRQLLVVDLGGGHYDVSVLEIDGGTITVHATDGDPTLGGEEWDAAIATHLADEFLRQHGNDLRRNHHATRRLRSAAERARKQLSRQSAVTISLPFIASGVSGPQHLNTTLTREQFEARTVALQARLREPIRRALEQARLSVTALDSVLLVGGGTRMPVARQVIREIVGQTPLEDVAGENLVALGAALHAGHLSGVDGDGALHEVTPLSLGLETMGGLMATIVPRNTPIPVRRSEVFGIAEEGLTDVKIRVLQGERPLAADNNELGVIHLENIPAAPRGVPQIEVTFEINAGGRLRVSARELASDIHQVLETTTGDTVADVDVQRLVQEAQSHEAEDLRKRTAVETRNLARQVIYQTERNLQHLNGVNNRAGCQDKRNEVNKKLAALKEAVEGHDYQTIRRLTNEIQDANIVLNELAYSLASKSGDEGRPDAAESDNAAGYRDITIERL